MQILRNYFLAVDHLAEAVKGAYDCAAQNGFMAENGEDISEVIPAKEKKCTLSKIRIKIKIKKFRKKYCERKKNQNVL